MGVSVQPVGTMTTGRWTVRYRIGTSQSYDRIVDAPSQADANKIFDAEMPNAQRCGSALPLRK
ncbi:MAG: hypothetical protein TE42_09260 [Candidatus Synechococcus spongiarum SP3]|uniref:Uncharacterized protein n=1 Tax=Candidatus Synechococcus spongiarum SP3 TaxID=1604020 RepID=A0A0G2HJ80_9SYNE|nr:MAG: hypothetical protein TE42_09260 [Candidatus Synechococcus spongiarum SP3]